MANFDPSQNRNPWADCNKNPHNWLRPREDTLNQIWYKSIHWGLLGIWVKYNVLCLFYLFIYTFFFSDSRTGQTGWWIFTRDSDTSKTAKITKRWYYSTAHWHLGDVLVGNHLFVIFAVFDVWCAVNSCINQFFTFINNITIKRHSHTVCTSHPHQWPVKECR